MKTILGFLFAISIIIIMVWMVSSLMAHFLPEDIHTVEDASEEKRLDFTLRHTLLLDLRISDIITEETINTKKQNFDTLLLAEKMQAHIYEQLEDWQYYGTEVSYVDVGIGDMIAEKEVTFVNETDKRIKVLTEVYYNYNSMWKPISYNITSFNTEGDDKNLEFDTGSVWACDYPSLCDYCESIEDKTWQEQLEELLELEELREKIAE